jgi:hypothetical protein
MNIIFFFFKCIIPAVFYANKEGVKTQVIYVLFCLLCSRRHVSAAVGHLQVTKLYHKEKLYTTVPPIGSHWFYHLIGTHPVPAFLLTRFSSQFAPVPVHSQITQHTQHSLLRFSSRKMELIPGSETSTHLIQTPGIYPENNTLKKLYRLQVLVVV